MNTPAFVSGNVVDLREHREDFSLPGIKFSVSARNVAPYLDMGDYLRLYFPYVAPGLVDSVFGFVVAPSPLYGGRTYRPDRALTNIHLTRLSEMGIHLSLNLTNHYFSDEFYEKSRVLLERHHIEGNSITCTSDRLAKRIRQDYPHYLLRASIIKKLNTRKRIESALQLYDQVVLPMEKNDDDELLASLPSKERIMLFANATCAYACPARTCYVGISQQIQGREETSGCSQAPTERAALGKVFFDVGKFHRMGFRNLKLVPSFVQQNTEEVARYFSARRSAAVILDRYLRKPAFYLCSFPKTGRTWLRFLLANYLNLYFGLGLDIDLESFFRLVPHDNMEAGKGVGIYDYYDDKRFPVLLCSHDAFSEKKFGKARVAFLVRSACDTVVSSYFQHAHVFTNDRAWQGSLKEFVRSRYGISAYCDHLNGWSDYLAGNDDCLVLAYEQMQRDIVGVARSLLEFMSLPVDEEKLATAVELSSFESMKAMEQRTRIPGINFAFSSKDPESARMRKGRVGAYRNYLDAEDVAYIRDYCEQHLSPQSKSLLVQSPFPQAEGLMDA